MSEKKLPTFGLERGAIKYMQRYRPKLGRTWPEILRVDPCCWCGGPGGTLDHVFAKGHRRVGVKRCGGGKRSEGPTVGACQVCNNARSNRTVLQFLGVRALAFGVLRGPLPPTKLGPGKRWEDL